MVLTKEEHNAVDTAMATIFRFMDKTPKDVLEVIITVLGNELQNR